MMSCLFHLYIANEQAKNSNDQLSDSSLLSPYLGLRSGAGQAGGRGGGFWHTIIAGGGSAPAAGRPLVQVNFLVKSTLRVAAILNGT
jgi:hypothetical protein